MKTDIQIARECQLEPIGNIAAQLGITPEEIEPYGRYMAKVPVSLIDEEKVKKLGCSGALNYDQSNPELGIFFNVKDANRLGFYVDIKTTFGKAKTNKDGSVTYPVTVKLKNNIDSKTLSKGKWSAYLTSNHGGDMRSLIYFVAPSGGKITKFKNNSKLKFKSMKYQKLQFYYNYELFWIKPKKSVTFTFNVTTAPGVNVKPKVVTTPLLTEYRNAKAPK